MQHWVGVRFSFTVCEKRGQGFLGDDPATVGSGYQVHTIHHTKNDHTKNDHTENEGLNTKEKGDWFS